MESKEEENFSNWRAHTKNAKVRENESFPLPKNIKTFGK